MDSTRTFPIMRALAMHDRSQAVARRAPRQNDLISPVKLMRPAGPILSTCVTYLSHWLTGEGTAELQGNGPSYEGGHGYNASW